MSSNELTERRSLCPSLVVTIIGQLWPTIEHLKVLNQSITLDKLKAHMYKKYRMTSNDCEKLVTNALKDKLLLTNDGEDKNGEKLTVYMIPEDNWRDDGHDWYCYECHKPGTVAQCVDCWRVFHSYCAKPTFSETGEPFICSICRDLSKEVEGKVGEKVVSLPELNQLLGYVYNRLIKNKEINNLVTIEDDDPNIRQLLYYRIDLSQIMFKTQNNSYKKLIEFQIDVENVVHCMSLLHGNDNEKINIIGLAAQALKDCIKELDELRECLDCYRNSNQRQDKNWFCKPCDPPHQLVFAKQKGYPYWPAKVIKHNTFTNEYEVRFFGSFHERSVIDESLIKPIDSTLQQLRITKQSPPLTQSLRELKQYQNNLIPIESIEAAAVAALRSPIRAASAKRPRRRADGSRPRKKSNIKTEIKTEVNEPNDTSNDSVALQPTEPTFISNSTPNKWRTSTPKPFAKSPINTRNRGIKVPFQTKSIDFESKGSPKRGRKALQKANKSPPKPQKLSSRTKKKTPEVVSTPTSAVKPKKNVNKRNFNLVNGLSDENEVSAEDSGHELADNRRAKRLKSDDSTSSLARSRPIRQIKPNSRFKSPEMEVKIPKRNLRNEKIVIKKEINDVSSPSTQINGENEYTFSEDSNPVNPLIINNTKTTKQTKKKAFNATKSVKPEVLANLSIDTTLPSPLSPQRSLAKLSPILNGPSTPMVSPIVSPKGRGRPKGVKNKSTIEKMKMEAMKTIPNKMTPNKMTPNKKIPILTKEFNFSSGKCNCDQKYNKLIEKFKKEVEAQHKEEIKQLKKDLETVKQLNYRLQNENKSLKSESQGKEDLNALKEKYLTQLSETKKKQWCFHCEKEAIYFCCWNTSYCSQDCQQKHWFDGHKKTCRRVNKK